jgi:queuine tRNA-ribosyltransferase
MKNDFGFKVAEKLTGGLARTGVISTPHGDIKTPAFIGAATKGTVKTLTFEQLDELGAQAILVNTYHLLLQPGLELLSQTGGIHGLSGYQKPIYSDSGGFQIMSLPDAKINADGVVFKSHINGAKFELTPETCVQAQHTIGSDIHMALDCPIGYGTTDNSLANAEKTLKITHDWAKRCLAEHQKYHDGQMLFGVVQGGEFADLRRQSAEFFATMEFDGFGIGGMYSSDSDGEKLVSLMNQILPKDKPRHWLGMGAEPRDLFVGVEHGIDSFDCVAPTRQARNGTLYSNGGRVNILNAKFRDDLRPIDPDCDCYTCRNHSQAYLHHLFKSGEITACTLASIHNEYFVVNLVEKIRQSIENGSFAEFKKTFLKRYYK